MPATATLDEVSSELVVHAARLVRAVRRAVEQPTGVRVLSLLDEHGGLGVTQLAELDRCAQPTMSGTVRTLLENGWVSRHAHPHDARAALITLTDDGREVLADFRAAAGHAIAQRLAAHGQHTPADVAAAVAVLHDVLGPETPEEGHL